MKQTYDSLEELMSSCATSVLKSNVSSILRSRIIPWSFVSASMDGDICSSEFSSCSPGAIPALPRAEF